MADIDAGTDGYKGRARARPSLRLRHDEIGDGWEVVVRALRCTASDRVHSGDRGVGSGAEARGSVRCPRFALSGGRPARPRAERARHGSTRAVARGSRWRGTHSGGYGRSPWGGRGPPGDPILQCRHSHPRGSSCHILVACVLLRSPSAILRRTHCMDVRRGCRCDRESRDAPSSSRKDYSRAHRRHRSDRVELFQPSGARGASHLVAGDIASCGDDRRSGS